MCFNLEDTLNMYTGNPSEGGVSVMRGCGFFSVKIKIKMLRGRGGVSLNLRVSLSCCKLSSTAIRSWLDGFVAFDFNRDKFLCTFFWVHKV
jgi:hypothetical protein